MPVLLVCCAFFMHVYSTLVVFLLDVCVRRVLSCADGVVVGGCGELCSALADKTGSKVAGEVCEVLCVVVGIKEFIAIIEKYVC